MSTRRERAKEPTTKLNKQLAEMEYVRKQNSIEAINKEYGYDNFYACNCSNNIGILFLDRPKRESN